MAQQAQKIRVKRAFYFNNELKGVGAVFSVPLNEARDLEASNKCEFVDPQTDDKQSSKIESSLDQNAHAQAAAKATGGPAKKDAK